MVFLIRFMVVFLFTILANPRIKLSVCHASSSGITLDLVHRDHLASPQLSRADRLSQMVRRDMQRCSSRRNNNNGGRRRLLEETATTTIQSGSDYGIGEYIVKINVGTPLQTAYMVPDTGSILNTFKCRHNGTGIFPSGPFFDADKSSSFTPIPCDTSPSSFCGNNLTFMATGDHLSKATCAGPACAYSDYSYTDGSSASGIFAYETFTFPQSVKNIVIGCSPSAENLNSINGTHGILGFGNFPLSFPAQTSPMFGGNFAMCLVDHLSNLSASGTFVFGDVLPTSDIMKYTYLDTKSLQGQRLYGLNVTGVYIDGKRMDHIPSDVWDNMNQNGGTMVDTGSSLTFLNQVAYGVITDALDRAISGSMDSIVDPKRTFKYCYNNTNNKYNKSAVPTLEIEFVEGVRLQPDPESYLIDVSESMKCLGFLPASATDGYSTIGNILLQHHFLVFNVQKKKFGFGKTGCTSTT